MSQPWTPILPDEIYDLVLAAENDMREDLERLRKLIKYITQR